MTEPITSTSPDETTVEIGTVREYARRLVRGAENRARTWLVHPTYDTKTDVLTAYKEAGALLDLVRYLEGYPSDEVVAGVDTRTFWSNYRKIRTYSKSKAGSRQPVLEHSLIG